MTFIAVLFLGQGQVHIFGAQNRPLLSSAPRRPPANPVFAFDNGTINVEFS